MYHDELIAAAPPEALCIRCFQHPLLMQLATDHALFMARTNRQGHQHWEQRHAIIKKNLNIHGTEVCAESWWWEKRPEEAADSMWKSWFYHPTGHKEVCIAKHLCYGAAMAKGRRVWYACIIVGDKTSA